jgi:hypothetical protein
MHLLHNRLKAVCFGIYLLAIFAGTSMEAVAKILGQ